MATGGATVGRWNRGKGKEDVETLAQLTHESRTVLSKCHKSFAYERRWMVLDWYVH